MRLPRILTAARLGALSVLVANGFAQAAASLALVAVVGATPGANGVGHQGWITVGASLALGITLFVLRVMQRRQGAAFALGYVREVRGRLVEQLFALPPTASRTRVGLVMTRLITDLSAMRSWLADGIAAFFVAGPSVILMGLGAFWLAPDIAPFLLAGILVWSAVTLLVLPFLNRAIRESRRRRGRLAGRLGDVVLARTTLSHFGKSGSALRKIDRMSELLNAWLVRRATWSGGARAASDLVVPIAIALLAASMLAGNPTIPAADLSTLLLLAGLTVAQLSELARAADYRLAHIQSRRRIAALLAMPTVSDPVDPIPLPRSRVGRQLRVERRSPDGRPPCILEAPPGAAVQLRTGAPDACSSFLAAIAGFEENDDVAVFLDDIPLAKVSQRDRRRTVTLLSPAIPLIRGTVAENIVIGAPSATSQASIAAVASLCGLAADFAAQRGAMRLEAPHGINSMQAARIRAARALVRSAAVLLIDDGDVCKDRDLFAAVLAHARAAHAVVIVACDVPADGEFDAVWQLDQHAPHQGEP